MRKVLCGLAFTLAFLLFISFRTTEFRLGDDIIVDSLRKLYAGPSSGWPKPTVDPGVNFEELGILPPSPINLKDSTTKKRVALGRFLFFDPRLSSSNQISCASCHAPDLNWSDGREVSIGHDHASNKRNAPSLENVWYFKNLFWDGRSQSLEDQAQSPLSSSIEMHQDMKLLPKKLKAIKGYQPLFVAAFGDKNITNERVFKSLADFQRTIVSRKSDFDRFLSGSKDALTDQQLVGLHLFRTKARCMNCHNGPLLTDNSFHNVGLTYYGREHEDLGRYNVTKKAEDVGKFKTPSLRNVMRTAPWFHNGLFADIDGVMNMYNVGMPVQRVRPEQVNDPLLPKNDKLLRGLRLSKAEKDAVVAFLHSISTIPWKDRQPVLPQ
jgi:cytochrome c peroxidase